MSETATSPTAREQVFMDYACDAQNRITNPGKFEGDPIFVPYFWDMGLEGFADADNGQVYTFKFKAGDEELQRWPELKQWLGRKRTLRLYEDGCGFVHCS